MLSGFQQLGAMGFRSAMSIAAVYWMVGFIAVIGLFIKSERVIWMGFVWSGLFLTLLFWIQINPFLEEARNLPRQLSSKSQEINMPATSWLAVDTTTIRIQPNLQVYTREIMKGTQPFDRRDTTTIRQLSQQPSEVLWLVDSMGLVQLQATLKPDTVFQLTNRRHWWGGEDQYWLFQSGVGLIHNE